MMKLNLFSFVAGVALMTPALVHAQESTAGQSAVQAGTQGIEAKLSASEAQMQATISAQNVIITQQRTWLSGISTCMDQAKFYNQATGQCRGLVIDISDNSHTFPGWTSGGGRGWYEGPPINLGAIVPANGRNIVVRFNFGAGWVRPPLTVNLGTGLSNVAQTSYRSNFRNRGMFHGDDVSDFYYSYDAASRTIPIAYSNWDIQGTLNSVLVTWTEFRLRPE